MPQLPGADTTMWDKANTSIFRKLIDQDTSDQVSPTPPSAQSGVHIQHVIEELRSPDTSPPTATCPPVTIRHLAEYRFETDEDTSSAVPLNTLDLPVTAPAHFEPGRATSCTGQQATPENAQTP
ncbi:hypothetical protein AB0A99_12975 [Streptomyces fradiae]|uniref:hypothetical protein n=1 Tax=Streptomyces fradiae TaxID=1906 RepID=UPI0033D2157E